MPKPGRLDRSHHQNFKETWRKYGDMAMILSLGLPLLGFSGSILNLSPISVKLKLTEVGRGLLAPYNEELGRSISPAPDNALHSVLGSSWRFLKSVWQETLMDSEGEADDNGDLPSDCGNTEFP